MSVKYVTAKTYKICDACGATCTHSNSPSEAVLTLRANALDYQGGAVANATRILDLCDKCFCKIGRAIDAAIDEIGSNIK